MTKGQNARRVIAAPPEEHSCAGAYDDLQGQNPAESGALPGAAGRLVAFPRNVIRVVWGVIVVLGIAVGVTWGVYHYTITSPRFAVKEVQVTGAIRTSHDDILKLGNFSLGDNLFKLDTAAIESRLVKDPWVRQAHVTRGLPTTLHVEIEEREAAAMAVIAGQLVLVTRQGEPFKEASVEDPSDLPSITGVTLDDRPRDSGLEKQRLAVAMEVLHHYSQVKLSRVYPPQEVHLTPGGEVVLMVGQKGIALHLGVGPWYKKFAMAERIFAKLQAQRSTPSLVFLDNRAHPERVVVRVN